MWIDTSRSHISVLSFKDNLRSRWAAFYQVLILLESLMETNHSKSNWWSLRRLALIWLSTASRTDSWARILNKRSTPQTTSFFWIQFTSILKHTSRITTWSTDLRSRRNLTFKASSLIFRKRLRQKKFTRLLSKIFSMLFLKSVFLDWR